MTRNLAASWLAVALLVPTSFAAAQPSVRVTAGGAVDGWSAGGDDSRELRSSVAATVDQAFADARGRAWANAELFTYSSPGDWTSVQVATGGSWKATLDRAHLAFYTGGSGMLRRNGDAWTAANVGAGGAFANLEWTPRATASMRAGYSIDYRRFQDLASLDHLQQQAFVSGLVNLPSRTTLIGEITVGTKRYAGLDDSEVLAAAMGPAASPAMDGVMGGNAGGTGSPIGTGVNAGGVNGNGNAGGGSGMGSTVSSRPSSTMIAAHQLGLTLTAGAVSSRQVTVFGRVAQSLAMRTSLSFDATRRSTFGDVPPAVITTPIELFEDGLYDDPFASDLTDLRLTLKHVLPNGIDLQASAARLDKPYRQTPAYAADGFFRADGALRHDRLTRASLAASIPVAPSHTGAWDIALLVRADYVSHRSNDAFAAYTSRALTLSTTIGR